MAGKIFINYRREDSIGMAGRLHDRLAHAFGRDNLFMDVDHIPVGADFVAHLNSQIAACSVFLVVIGPNWLNAKDESGERRLDNPDDFVAIEIAAALCRDIRVIPVLVDGARMPKTKELPDSLKLLVRRQAVEVRHTHFGHDAEALVARMGGAPKPGRWSIWKIASGAAVTVLLLSGWGCYELVQFVMTPERNLQQRREAGQQSLDTVKAGEHQAPAGQAAAKPKAEQAEQQQLGGALRTEGERPELRARTDALLEQGNDASDAGDYNRAIATYTEGIRLDPGFMLLFYSRGNAYAKMKDYDRAIADYSEAIRLDPNYVPALTNRGMVYWSKGLYDRAIVDYDEVIRINPNVAFAFNDRGLAYAKKNDYDRAIADYSEAIRLDRNYAFAFNNRGLAYATKGDYDRAIPDYNEAIRLNAKFATAFCNRGKAKLKINDTSGNEDIAKARQLDPLNYCRGGAP